MTSSIAGFVDPEARWAAAHGVDAETARRAATGEAGASEEALEAALAQLQGTDLPATAIGTLSPESFLALIRLRLGDLDQQVTSAANNLEARSREAQDLSSQLQALSKVQQLANANGAENVYLHGHGEDELVIGGAEVTVQQYLEMNGVPIPPQTSYGGHDGISAETLQAAIDETKQKLQSVNSGNEMTMIQLQSVMQQRQQVISLGTNVLNIFHESQQGVIRNIT